MDLENEVIKLLKKYSIEHVLTLPCAKIKRLLKLTAENFHHIPLSREEEGVGIATGIHLAGKKSAMMFQSGGIGNSLNALLSLAQIYEIPIPILISWRGVYKERIEAQRPMGEYLPGIFDAVKLPYFIIEEKEDIKKIDEAFSFAFSKSLPVGIFISPKFWEQSKYNLSKQDEDVYPTREFEVTLGKAETTITSPKIIRYKAIETLRTQLKNKIIVSNIGIPSKELYELLDQPTNFYMLGSFGMASAIGLGISIAKENEVVVIDGDASILTNPNILGTIIQERKNCSNLTILLMDNGTCGSTGNQLTSAFGKIDLEFIARAYGFDNVVKAYDSDEIINAYEKKSTGPRLLHFILKPGNAKVENIPLSALAIKERFMNAIKTIE